MNMCANTHCMLSHGHVYVSHWCKGFIADIEPASAIVATVIMLAFATDRWASSSALLIGILMSLAIFELAHAAMHMLFAAVEHTARITAAAKPGVTTFLPAAATFKAWSQCNLPLAHRYRLLPPHAPPCVLPFC